MRKCPSGVNAASRKICGLVDLWAPRKLILREGAPRRKQIFIVALARKAKVPIRSVRRSAVQDTFRSSKRPSRFEIARAVTGHYPELLPFLPAGRKLGYAEPFQMFMFNAVATGMGDLGVSIGAKECFMMSNSMSLQRQRRR